MGPTSTMSRQQKINQKNAAPKKLSLTKTTSPDTFWRTITNKLIDKMTLWKQ